MKKILSLFIVSVMLVASIVVSGVVYAADEPTIVVSQVEGKTGETVTVDVEIANNPGFGCLEYKVSYDQNALELVSYSIEDCIGNDACTEPGDTEASTLTFAYATRAGVNAEGDGTLVSFEFKILAKEEGTTEITVTPTPGVAFTYNGRTEVDFSLANAAGSVTIVKEQFPASVKLTGKTVTYNGEPQSIEVVGLTGDLSDTQVVYSPETVTNAGTHTITATLTKEGYTTKVLEADIIINKKNVEITGLKAQDKVFDTTAEAVITGGELKGVIEGDAVEANIPEIGEFASANVGTRIAVAYEEIVLSGDDAENYVLKTQPALTAKITVCPVTITTKTLVKAGKLEGQDDPEGNYGYDIEPAWADEYIDVVVTRKPGEAKGEYPINATYTNNSNFKVTVNKGIFTIDDKYTQTVVVPTIEELVYGYEGVVSIAVTPDAESGITDFTYESTNEDVVTVDVNGDIAIVGAGEAKIIITSDGNDEYNAYYNEVAIVVNPMTISEIAYVDYDSDDELVIALVDGTEIKVDLSGATVEVDENGEVTLSNIALLSGNFVLAEEVVIPTFTAPAEKLITVESEETENGFVEGTGTYLIGSKVTLTAVPSTGYRVKNFEITNTEDGEEYTDILSSASNEFVFIAANDVTASAEFARKTSSVVIPANGSNKKPGTGTVTNKTASQIILTIGSVDAQVYGEAVANDVAPIIEKDRTMLPARFVAESLGAYVAWDNAQRKVTIHKNLTMIEIYIDSDIAYINGNPVTLDSPAFIRNDRTYTPVRFVAEALGATVEWNELLRQVVITRN